MDTPCSVKARSRRGPLAVALILVVFPGRQPCAFALDEIDFNRDVKPILAANCFRCHGPDEHERKADLRLDLAASATADLGGYAAIRPGDSSASELLARITAADPDEIMPPPKAGPALNPVQIETLRRWIDTGAEYARHWAFVKPVRPDLPVMGRPAAGAPASGIENPGPARIASQSDAGGSSIRSPIDAFVLARLESEELAPSPEAGPHVLLRRVFLDLTGLPPQPGEVAAFLADWQRDREDAFESCVDGLLGRPEFGERWAALWLDLARYADSMGYASDNLRSIWAYRDWVIDAINANMPYDQFTLEQMAGDLLPNAAAGQRIATAFHRNTMNNTEGGTDDEEFRVASVKDRVSTTMNVWMGLTMRCAECHTHKYDPITQEEYYRFYDFFNQSADADTNDDAPIITVPWTEKAVQEAALDEKIAALRAQMATVSPATLIEEQREWEAVYRGEIEWRTLPVTEVSSLRGATLEAQADGSIFVSGYSPPNDSYSLEIPSPPQKVSAFRLETIPDERLPTGGSGRSPEGRFILSRFAAWLDSGDEKRQLTFTAASADFSEKRSPVSYAINVVSNSGKGWSVAPNQRELHEAVFAFGAPIEIQSGERLTLNLDHHNNFGGQLTLGRFRVSVTDDPSVLRRAELSPAMLRIIDEPESRRSAAERQRLASYFREFAPSLGTLRAEVAALEKQRDAVEAPTVPVMQELPAEKRRATHLQVRGNFLDLGKEVKAAVPAEFHDFPEEAPRDRIGVARWLTHPDNPLTARVAVNRLWAQLFGIGLVETEEDFGAQGTYPSHPELLDWLATEYVRLGWDTKAILKTMVMSAAYRRSSAASRESYEADPDNRLLARGPRFRLDAEQVRDQALALSGLLVQKVGGPSVYPPQPPGMWRAAFNGKDRNWATSEGEDRFRRGLYTFWRRSVPYPSMATFDAPSREVCNLRRIRTNTPLQAFVTLNDPVYVEIARAMARRIVDEGGDTDAERIDFALRLVLVRPPTAEEVATIADFYQAELKEFLDHPEAANELAGDTGQIPSPAALAAWTSVSNILLNLDAVLTKS